MLIEILTLLVMSFAIAMILSKRLCDPSSLLYILDHPNMRSLHDEPTPRGGGLAILAALLITWPLSFLLVDLPDGFIWLVLGLGMITAISFLDDRTHIHPAFRLLVQAGAAMLALMMAGFGLTGFTLPTVGTFSLPWSGMPVSILFVIWFTNLYNFMDGMDGFAGGMGVIGFSVLSIMGWVAGDSSFGFAAMLVAAANFGFLVLNFPPAKIFMGDVGSAGQGFLAGVFSLWGVRDGIFPLWIPLLVFSPFIVDATTTLIRRLFAGEKVWLAHRSHYYQRLVQLGWGHRKTVYFELLLMLIVGISAILLNHSNEIWGLIGILGWAGIYALMALGVHRLEMKARVST